jgi:hypothetical protein
MLLRRTGLVVTLALGLGLLAASLHGMTQVDTTLRLAAATPAPQLTPPDLVSERHHRGGRDCRREHPRV